MDDETFTIDQLSAKSRVPSRTIRYYQSNGALPKPTIKGRVAHYTRQHLERLRLIGQLQDRGLKIKAIKELLGRADKGEVVLTEWLGFEAQLRTPWGPDQPEVWSVEQLNQAMGDAAPGSLADMQRLKLIDSQGPAYLVKSPALLRICLGLQKQGVDLEVAVGALDLLRKHLAKTAAELTSYVFKHATAAGDDIGADDLAKVVAALRPAGLESLHVIFGQEMQKNLQEFIQSGKATKLAALARKAEGQEQDSQSA